MLRKPDRNLAMELVRATEAAAIASSELIGRGDKNAADRAAVDAMRGFLSTVDFAGTVIIGEGEKDSAPMLYNGEVVGSGNGPVCDVAVDPLDGTSLTAAGRSHAISVIAVSDRGSMFNPLDVFYMQKIVTNNLGAGAVSLALSPKENIRELAKRLNKPTSEITVAILDRPRHADLIEEVRSAGARTRLFLDGDVAASVHAMTGEGNIDMLYGTGGAPEAAITACAVKALGGHMQARINPQSDLEMQKVKAAGHDLTKILDQNDLVASENTYFVATGVTDGMLLKGVERHGKFIRTESIILRSQSGTIRRVTADYLASRWV
ncbi:MAG: fructose 1,6-bisphosphatase [Actinomycetota bacterium]|jgi:fructose-1,6-bisphosphatase II